MESCRTAPLSEIARVEAPNVAAWYELQDRPAYREHIMIPSEDMRGRLSFQTGPH